MEKLEIWHFSNDTRHTTRLTFAFTFCHEMFSVDCREKENFCVDEEKVFRFVVPVWAIENGEFECYTWQGWWGCQIEFDFVEQLILDCGRVDDSAEKERRLFFEKLSKSYTGKLFQSHAPPSSTADIWWAGGRKRRGAWSFEFEILLFSRSLLSSPHGFSSLRLLCYICSRKQRSHSEFVFLLPCEEKAQKSSKEERN